MLIGRGVARQKVATIEKLSLFDGLVTNTYLAPNSIFQRLSPYRHTVRCRCAVTQIILIDFSTR